MPDQSRPDVPRIIEVLDRHGVDYLVIGGVATQAYGAERPTADFDCLVRRTGATQAFQLYSFTAGRVESDVEQPRPVLGQASLGGHAVPGIDPR